MGFEHTCFISYVHGQFRLTRTFIEQLKDALESELEPLGGSVYFDQDRLKPGFKFNVSIARALCQSMSMLVVWTPSYELHPYCLREYTAMRRLERLRLKALKGHDDKGMIIPLLFRGDRDELPPPIRNHIHYADFSRFTLKRSDIAQDDEYADCIREIAAYLHQVHKACESAGVGAGPDCMKFRLPPESKVERWRPRPGPRAAGFPGLDAT
jgi:hypothetical protein